ncbi:MAG: anthranilate synthase component I family protein [Simkaniaceae bacterium]|nr:anthranilate synthase component I family protein [Simkaniaceae bacterium]
MFQQISEAAFLQLKKENGRVLLYKEYPADLHTPAGVASYFKEQGEEITLLESGDRDPELGRYSFIGFSPRMTLTVVGEEISLEREGKKEKKEGDPFCVLRQLHQEAVAPSDRHIPGFIGGAVGYIAYDAIRYVESIPDRHLKDQEYPDFFFRFYDQGIIFDHTKSRLILALIDTDYERGMQKIAEMHQNMENGGKSPPKKGGEHPISVNLSDAEYGKRVEKAIEYIRAGDIFQVVLARTYQMPYYTSPFNVYRSLRMLTSAPYMFYIEAPTFAMAGASPEKLISVRGKQLEVIPLAGTRPRGKGEEDVLIEKELLADPKEDAEHMMLVDLGRNDVGSIAEKGSVYVDRLKVVHRFSHVMHLASYVRGTLRDGLDAIDALRKTFPAGTLSGAPKIRAMEIIDELEPVRRGPYGGAVVMIDHRGDLESCIPIRMALLKGGVASIRVGAGIVFDSDPQKEAEETWNKAKVVIRAVEMENTI